jgi:hypothetical protein
MAYEPTYDLKGDIYLTCIWIVIFFIIDCIFKYVIGWMVNEKNSRYFSIHVICNTIVSFLSISDVIRVYSQPVHESFLDAKTDTRACMIIGALHLYHIIAYQPLNSVDWVHHILMVVICLPFAYALQPGPLLNHGAFFASGLPGGLDYLMLVCVKAGWMESLEEKRINSNIQSWIRNPGMLYHALHTWMCWIAVRGDEKMSEIALEKSLYGNYFTFSIGAFVVMITYFWNGPYFQQRVAENYGMKSPGRIKTRKNKKVS